MPNWYVTSYVPKGAREHESRIATRDVVRASEWFDNRKEASDWARQTSQGGMLAKLTYDNNEAPLETWRDGKQIQNEQKENTMAFNPRYLGTDPALVALAQEMIQEEVPPQFAKKDKDDKKDDKGDDKKPPFAKKSDDDKKDDSDEKSDGKGDFGMDKNNDDKKDDKVGDTQDDQASDTNDDDEEPEKGTPAKKEKITINPDVPMQPGDSPSSGASSMPSTVGLKRESAGEIAKQIWRKLKLSEANDAPAASDPNADTFHKELDRNGWKKVHPGVYVHAKYPGHELSFGAKGFSHRDPHGYYSSGEGLDALHNMFDTPKWEKKDGSLGKFKA